jgi:hypothetical protein
MDEVEAIAEWLETLHCDNWKDDGPGCWKSHCQTFRSLAEDIRSGAWKGTKKKRL